MSRTFKIYRRGDLSATHNKDQVNGKDEPQLEGVVFEDGTTVIRWLTSARSTAVFADLDSLLRIHGHMEPGSKHGTELLWDTAVDNVLTEEMYAALKAVIADVDNLDMMTANERGRTVPAYDLVHAAVEKVEKRNKKTKQRPTPPPKKDPAAGLDPEARGLIYEALTNRANYIETGVVYLTANDIANQNRGVRAELQKKLKALDTETMREVVRLRDLANLFL